MTFVVEAVSDIAPDLIIPGVVEADERVSKHIDKGCLSDILGVWRMLTHAKLEIHLFSRY